MKRRLIPVLMCLLVLTLVLAGCGSSGPAASPSASPSAGVSPSADASASPSAAPSPDAFVMGTVKSVSGDTITLTVVEHNGASTTNSEKTITVSGTTTYTVSGSLKTAALTDIAVGDVISATLSGTTAIKVIDNGPDVNPDPSAYISPSPSPSDAAAASPSA